MREKRKLMEEPPQQGGRWVVTLPGGSVDHYACAIDGSRAFATARAALEVSTELERSKAAWTLGLVEAGEGSEARYGHMAVPLGTISKACLDLLLEEAIDK